MSTSSAAAEAVVLAATTHPEVPMNWLDLAADVYCLTGRLPTKAATASAPAQQLVSDMHGLYERTMKRHGGQREKLEMAARSTVEQLRRTVMDRGPSSMSRTRLTAGSRLRSELPQAQNSSGPQSTLVSSRGYHIPLSAPRLGAVVERLCGAECSDAFMTPVGAKVMMTGPSKGGPTLGPYADVIKQPMHLGSIQQRIHAKTITTLAELRADVAQIAANCIMFNAPEGDFPKMARTFYHEAILILDAAALEAARDPRPATDSGEDAGGDDAPSRRKRR